MKQLIDFIEEHGQVAFEQDGDLMVLAHSSDREGRSYYEWERIDANYRAAKNGLGY